MNCGRGEWTGPPGTLCFHGFGEERRCDACYFSRIGNDGQERPSEEWYVVLQYPYTGMNGCGNPLCAAPEAAGTMFHGIGIYRRCNPCHQYIAYSGRERNPAQLAQTKQNRREQRTLKGASTIPAELRTGCQNPNCLKPEPVILVGGDFVGKGAERRCKRCYIHRQKHKNERTPEPEMVKDGCKNPNCLVSEEGAKILHGSGEERRCQACYMFKRRNDGRERVPGVRQKQKKRT
ncbi:hypothetical protein C8A01DRAFT_21022 [Parachaetomium inaequale]|uniref:Uncharacterized protein n=1 Tax=Parachaetomium inaequale TaxID=2588326 RepID=A0AAN6P6Q2_9PEZI|nr:hypothetical protein C8A01DRAFT_21022 [Parachaetomium inaequale]